MVSRFSSLILILTLGSSSRRLVEGAPQSKCPNTNCTPAPTGTTCNPTYDREDGCCPVWHCANGMTAYGKSSSSNSFSSSSTSMSFGTGGQLHMPNLGMPGFPSGFPGFGGGGIGAGAAAGFPFFGR